MGLGLVVTLSTSALLARPAAAQSAALDDDEDDPAPVAAPVDPLDDPNRVQIGVGLRLRYVMLPQSLLELFVARAAGGAAHPGFGVELVRRKGNFEVQFAVEYESLSIKDGVWIDKGDSIPQDEPDFVEFDGFGWVGAEVNFLYHTPIADQFAVRYGGGVGLGLILGEILRTDYVCSTEDVASCNEKPGDHQVKEPEDDVPPVFPMINFLVGVQIKPVDKMFINVEGGIRTIPFFGATVGYFF